MDVDEEGDSSKKENCRKIHLLELSDEILLVILQNLDSPSLFSLANTCERFRILVKEKKLWTHFDFQTEKLTALELLRRMHFLNQETRSFRVRGLTANYPFSSWDNPTITGNMLTMLKDSCPNLETLSVVEGFINFNKINILHFPSSLRRLELNKCEVPKPKMPQMFFHRIDTHMSRLEVLCLEESYWFETHDLVLFSKMPELRVLNLNGSNSMTHCVPYASIASRYGFKKLEVLDLRNTPVSDSDIQCFNITSTLKELLLECPRNLRDDVRIVNQPSSSGTRKRRTSHHSLTRLRGKKRRGSDTEGSSDRPQESTENDDEDSSSDSCTRTRPVKCLRTGRPASEVISITLSCDQNRAQGAAGGSRSVVTFPFRIDGQQGNGAGAGPRPSVQVVEGDPEVLAAQQQQQQQQSNGAEGPSSSSAPAAPSLSPTAAASSSSSNTAAAAASADQNAPPPAVNPPLAPPPMNMPQVEIRQNGQMVRMNPIVIHNNNALGPIIIISGPPPTHRTMRHMRIQVFKKKKKARKRRTAKGGAAAGGEAGSSAGSSAGGGGGGGGNKNGEDSVEGDDENEPEDSDGSDDGSEEDDYEDDDEDGEDNYRPGFYTPSAMNLISDRGICSFGVSPNNVMPNWIWIRAEAKNPNTSIERLVVRNYRQVTDTSLQHMKTCAPKLVYLDVSGTAVTKEAVEQFRIERPDCTVVADV